jgi:hypothetical protein
MPRNLAHRNDFFPHQSPAYNMRTRGGPGPPGKAGAAGSFPILLKRLRRGQKAAQDAEHRELLFERATFATVSIRRFPSGCESSSPPIDESRT